VEVPYLHRHAWHLYTPLVDIDRLTIIENQFMQELKTVILALGCITRPVHEFSYHAKNIWLETMDFPETHFVSDPIFVSAVVSGQ